MAQTQATPTYRVYRAKGYTYNIYRISGANRELVEGGFFTESAALVACAEWEAGTR